MPELMARHRLATLLVTSSAALLATTAYGLPAFEDWQTPAPIEALPGSATSLNTPAIDGCVSLSRDGLTLYFNSNRAGTHDIYVATRPDTNSGFAAPQRLPAPVNTTTKNEFCPTITPGKHLYFSSGGSAAEGDIFVTKLGPNGWSEPESLGPNINTADFEESPAFYDDAQGNQVVLFGRRNPDGSGARIFVSVNGGPASLVSGGPNSAGDNNHPSVSHDGLTIYFDSIRPGGLGGPDLYFAKRDNTGEPFGPAVPLTALSSAAFDGRPFINWDGGELLFSSNRAGSESPAPDIWRTVRKRSRGGPKVIYF